MDEVGEIRQPVFGGHLPEDIQVGIVPVEFFGDVVGRDGESEYPPLGVPLQHHLQEGAVKHIYFLLKFLISNILRFAAYDHPLSGVIRRDGEVHGYVCERGLETHPGGNVDVKKELLERLLHPFIVKTVKTDERREQSIEIGESLRPGRFSLQGVEKIGYLPQRRAQVPRRF